MIFYHKAILYKNQSYHLCKPPINLLLTVPCRCFYCDSFLLMFALLVFLDLFSHYACFSCYLRLDSWVTTYLEKGCWLGLSSVPFFTAFTLLLWLLSLGILWTGFGIWIYRFLIVALFSLHIRFLAMQADLKTDCRQNFCVTSKYLN